MVVVPVMVKYDRIFECQNMAIEMINGERIEQQLTSLTVSSVIGKNSHSIGNVYFKYLKPIHVQKYINELTQGAGLRRDSFEKTALQFSSHLMMQ